MVGLEWEEVVPARWSRPGSRVKVVVDISEALAKDVGEEMAVTGLLPQDALGRNDVDAVLVMTPSNCTPKWAYRLQGG